MNTTTSHVALHIDGALKEKDLSGMLSDECRSLSDSEVREVLLDHKKKGFEVFCGCDNTDERGACAGHVWRECYWCDEEIEFGTEEDLPGNRGVAHKECAEEYYCVQAAE